VLLFTSSTSGQFFRDMFKSLSHPRAHPASISLIDSLAAAGVEVTPKRVLCPGLATIRPEPRGASGIEAFSTFCASVNLLSSRVKSDVMVFRRGPTLGGSHAQVLAGVCAYSSAMRSLPELRRLALLQDNICCTIDSACRGMVTWEHQGKRRRDRPF
jgi:hypothetical protein